MLNPRCSLPLLMALALATACDSGTKNAKPAQPQAKAKTGDAKPVTAHGGAKAPGANPHGAETPGANPHGAPPAGANPHGDGMPPMRGAAPKPAGPPRDITPSGETTPEVLPGLNFNAPKEWEKATPSSAMRLAQFVLPGPGGDAELLVFRFPGGAGTLEANLNRWRGQFRPPEGKTIDDVTTTTKVEGKEGLTTTLVDVSGTYVAAMVPGSDDKRNDADSRMLAAIVDGSGDSFYFKAVGPKATMDLWAEPFSTMIDSFAKAEAKAATP